MTPFRGFVREATRRELETKITVLYSVRTTNDIIFHREFLELALRRTPTSISRHLHAPAPGR